MITGINHINLSVRDLNESVNFYTSVLGFKLKAKWKRGAYCLAGNLWFCLFLDDKTRKQALPEYTHIAFDIAPKEFGAMAMRIRQSGAPIWQENTSEGDSLYFLDTNGHKLELHCSTLQNRLTACKAEPYEGIEIFD